MKTIRAGLIGISGYTGMELARLLVNHPCMNLVMACSRSEAGKKLGDFYPFLRSQKGADLEIANYDPDLAARSCDIVFLAVPAGTAMKMALELSQRNIKVVDFSADFRLVDPEEYRDWYKQEHSCPTLLKSAVYGLPELNAEKIRTAMLVANPGCYPTASILALCAALKSGIVQTSGIIIDAKSGASGAGRKPALTSLFCEISDDFRAYGLPRHRHTPEIEQELSNIAGEKLVLNFTPHLVPMKRGILATIYCRLATDKSEAEIENIYREYWQDFPWIRIMPYGELPRTINVRGSMFCDIGIIRDKRTNTLILLSAIDNLCRGASGQALANANLMCGLPMEMGLEMAPLV